MFNKEKIIQLLKEKGWTPYKLCKEANMAQSTLSDILNGKKKNPTAATIQKIAAALGVTVDEFFSDSNES
jgi:transcriptional regulator with XRE-family HTH domain